MEDSCEDEEEDVMYVSVSNVPRLPYVRVRLLLLLDFVIPSMVLSDDDDCCSGNRTTELVASCSLFFIIDAKAFIFTLSSVRIDAAQFVRIHRPSI